MLIWTSLWICWMAQVGLPANPGVAAAPRRNPTPTCYGLVPDHQPNDLRQLLDLMRLGR